MAKIGKSRNKRSNTSLVYAKRRSGKAIHAHRATGYRSDISGKIVILRDEGARLQREDIQRHSASIEYLLKVEKDELESMDREIQMLKSGKFK